MKYIYISKLKMEISRVCECYERERQISERERERRMPETIPVLLLPMYVCSGTKDCAQNHLQIYIAHTRPRTQQHCFSHSHGMFYGLRAVHIFDGHLFTRW